MHGECAYTIGWTNLLICQGRCRREGVEVLRSWRLNIVLTHWGDMLLSTTLSVEDLLTVPGWQLVANGICLPAVKSGGVGYTTRKFCGKSGSWDESRKSPNS